MIPITWSCPMLTLADSTPGLIGTNIEKCDMQFVTPTFDPPCL